MKIIKMNNDQALNCGLHSTVNYFNGMIFEESITELNTDKDSNRWYFKRCDDNIGFHIPEKYCVDVNLKSDMLDSVDNDTLKHLVTIAFGFESMGTCREDSIIREIAKNTYNNDSVTELMVVCADIYREFTKRNMR